MRATAAAAAVIGGVVIGLAAPAAAHEAGHVINGSAIRPHSIAGNRLKNNTITGAQVKESTLGTVPRALAAKTAQTASTADTATTAQTATVASSLPALVWQPLTLKNGWAVHPNYGTPEYAIDAQGIVHLRGAIQGGVSGGVAFSFPSTILSPDVQALYPVAANNGNLALMTVTDGAFCPLDGVAPAGSVAGFTDLDGITFPVSLTGPGAVAP